MSKDKVVEADYTVVEEEVVAPEVRCEITGGIDAEGNAYYRITGTDQSLILLDGLIDYQQRIIDALWRRTLEVPNTPED